MNPLFQNIQLTDTLKTFCKETRGRLRDDWDAVIGIEGADPGIGKTCLLIQLGVGIDPDNFDLDRSMFYLASNLRAAASRIEKQFNDLAQYGFYGIDEAEDVLYKMMWYMTIQQIINMNYMKERKQNKCTGLCIPRFIDLNEFFRNYRVKYRIWIPKRGFGIAYIRDPDKDVEDPWHVKENLAIKKKEYHGRKIATLEIEEIIKAETKTPNFWFEFQFNDLPVEVWNEYRRIHAYYKSLQEPMFDRLNQREIKWRNACVKVVEIAHKKGINITQTELAKAIGMPEETLRSALTSLRVRP
jgi:hypothetical protein